MVQVAGGGEADRLMKLVLFCSGRSKRSEMTVYCQPLFAAVICQTLYRVRRVM